MQINGGLVKLGAIEEGSACLYDLLLNTSIIECIDATMVQVVLFCRPKVMGKIEVST